MSYPIKTAQTYSQRRRLQEWSDSEMEMPGDEDSQVAALVGVVIVGISVFVTLGLALCGLVWGLTRGAAP